MRLAPAVAGHLIAAGIVGLTFGLTGPAPLSYGVALGGVAAIVAGVKVWRAR